jgi:hypothetical protein
MWTRKRLLVWGTTYPEFSKKHYETVCTGAIDGDTRQLLRIYPITLRYLKEPFARYQWIEVPTQRNTKDPRPESYHIQQEAIVLGDTLDTKKQWASRSEWVLSPGNLYQSVEALKAAQADNGTSLWLVRPRKINRFYVKRKPESERQEWEEKREQAIKVKELFVDAEAKTRDLAFMPISYRVDFLCNDASCKGHDMSILDWGVYVLSRKIYGQSGDATAQKKVLEKLEEICNLDTHDCYFFLGNTQAHPASFMVVGIYYPPRVVQKSEQEQMSSFGA